MSDCTSKNVSDWMRVNRLFITLFSHASANVGRPAFDVMLDLLHIRDSVLESPFPTSLEDFSTRIHNAIKDLHIGEVRVLEFLRHQYANEQQQTQSSEFTQELACDTYNKIRITAASRTKATPMLLMTLDLIYADCTSSPLPQNRDDFLARVIRMAIQSHKARENIILLLMGELTMGLWVYFPF